jgi:hypothetical protein
VWRRGKFAEILAESRAFTPEESQLFDRSAQHAYESFRNKAAESRGMAVEDMQVGRGGCSACRFVCRLGWGGSVLGSASARHCSRPRCAQMRPGFS